LWIHRLNSITTSGQKESLRVFAGDEARAAIARDVVVDPLGEHEETVLELHQIHQVDENPREPREKAGDAYETEIGDGLVAADGRQVSLIEIVEGFVCGTPVDAGADEARYVAALLHGDGRDTGQWFAVLVAEDGKIADHKDFGVARDAQVRLDNHAAGAV